MKAPRPVFQTTISATRHLGAFTRSTLTDLVVVMGSAIPLSSEELVNGTHRSADIISSLTP